VLGRWIHAGRWCFANRGNTDGSSNHTAVRCHRRRFREHLCRHRRRSWLVLGIKHPGRAGQQSDRQLRHHSRSPSRLSRAGGTTSLCSRRNLLLTACGDGRNPSDSPPDELYPSPDGASILFWNHEGAWLLPTAHGREAIAAGRLEHTAGVPHRLGYPEGESAHSDGDAGSLPARQALRQLLRGSLPGFCRARVEREYVVRHRACIRVAPFQRLTIERRSSE